MSVVLPESMCAEMPMLRMRSRGMRAAKGFSLLGGWERPDSTSAGFLATFPKVEAFSLTEGSRPRQGWVMTVPTLSRCAGCACFFRMSESVCPFCGAESRARRAAEMPRDAPPAMRACSRSAVWAFGVPVLALAASACGGTTTSVGGEDAATEASPDPSDDAGGDDAREQPDGGVGDAAEEPVPDAHNTCDVFVGVDYGLPPCQ